jgi:hypothetical protein
MDSFVRAKDTGALINTNAKELQLVKKKREETKVIRENSKRLDVLENEVKELRELVTKLTKGTIDV